MNVLNMIYSFLGLLMLSVVLGFFFFGKFNMIDDFIGLLSSSASEG